MGPAGAPYDLPRLGSYMPGDSLEREALTNPFDSPRAWIDAIQWYADPELTLPQLKVLLDEHIVFTRYDGVELPFRIGLTANGSPSPFGGTGAPRWTLVNPVGSLGFDLDEIEWFCAPKGVTVACRMVVDRPDMPFIPYFAGTGEPSRVGAREPTA